MSCDPIPDGYRGRLTQVLSEWHQGDADALGAVFELAERELRSIARQRVLSMNQDRCSVTPADLLQEAMLKVLQSRPEFKNSRHFLATMSLMMRSILVDAVRAAMAQSRGGGGTQVTYTDALGGHDAGSFDLLALDQALRQLEKAHPRTSEIMHLTYFTGMSNFAVAELTEMSVATVERELKFGRAWVNRALDG